MKRNNKFGFSLTEISLAVLIFALCAIPLYYAITYGSNEEIHLEKTAIANKILESFRDEVKNLDFETAKSFMNIDGTQLPANSYKTLFEAQQKYKDYKLKSTGKHIGDGSSDELERIEFKVEVTWTSAKGKESSQSMSFVKVK